jgi:NHL repeat
MNPGRRWSVAGGLVLLWVSGCDRAEPGGSVRKSDPCDEPGGVICTWMGLPGFALFSEVGVDRKKVGLYFPQDLQFGPDGVGYVADYNNHRVLAVQPDGLVSTVTGTGFPGDGPHDGGSCDDGCDAGSTEIWHPSQVTVDPARPGVVVTSAWHDHRLVATDLVAGETTWVLGAGESGFGTDPVTLSYPSSTAIAPDGTWYVADQGNQVIRRLGVDGALTVLAGSPGEPGYGGDGGPAELALLHGQEEWIGSPTSKLLLDDGVLYFADTLNGVIRRIDLDSGTIDRVAGVYVDGAEVGSFPGYAGDGGDALDAVFSLPRAVAFGLHGELYVADTGNHCVRVVDPSGVITTFAGRCGELGFAGDEGPAAEALLHFPCGVVVDAVGNVYISDSNNQVIRRVTPAAPDTGS